MVGQLAVHTVWALPAFWLASPQHTWPAGQSTAPPQLKAA